MANLLVVNNPKRWRIHPAGAHVISAREYLTNVKYSEMRKANIYNLCNSYRYQSQGYYVSLLAAARGHRPMPGIETIQDMKTLSILRLMSDELNDLIQKTLKPLQSDRFILSMYFGRNLAKRYERLSSQLFKLFQAPMLRAEFRLIDERWSLHHIKPVSGKDIPDEHFEFAANAAEQYFHSQPRRSARQTPRYHLAILHNPDEDTPPSDDRALAKFIKAARRAGMSAELIEKDDYGDLPQYDGLFIRETTNVNHHTYRFSRRAAAEGMAVIDDPVSIQRCTNKVFLAELLSRKKIPHPRSMIVHRDNRHDIQHNVGLPCIVKMPDSSFSQGVFKADDDDSLQMIVDRLLGESELIIAQPFMPTEFDWRVGALDKKALYVCKYFMARKHWQIQTNASGGETRYGKVEAVSLSDAPGRVIQTALKAANAIGDGLYGVDLKQIGSKVYVIEINDNPSIESGYEDAIEKDAIYDAVILSLLRRIHQDKA